MEHYSEAYIGLDVSKSRNAVAVAEGIKHAIDIRDCSIGQLAADLDPPGVRAAFDWFGHQALRDTRFDPDTVPFCPKKNPSIWDRQD
jgi:hypothetical protein